MVLTTLNTGRALTQGSASSNKEAGTMKGKALKQFALKGETVSVGEVFEAVEADMNYLVSSGKAKLIKENGEAKDKKPAGGDK